MYLFYILISALVLYKRICINVKHIRSQIFILHDNIQIQVPISVQLQEENSFEITNREKEEISNITDILYASYLLNILQDNNINLYTKLKLLSQHNNFQSFNDVTLKQSKYGFNIEAMPFADWESDI